MYIPPRREQANFPAGLPKEQIISAAGDLPTLRKTPHVQQAKLITTQNERAHHGLTYSNFLGDVEQQCKHYNATGTWNSTTKR